MPDAQPGLPLLGLRCAVLGSTSGIGRATALELARQGADVIVHGRNDEVAERVVGEVRRLGRRAEAILADLASRREGDRLAESAWGLWGGLDAWLHFAGADTLTGASARLPFDAKLDLLWEVDVVAAMRLCRDVGRRMHGRGRGAIVTMGWDQSETGMEGDSGELFAATKGAVTAFSRSLALSLALLYSRTVSRNRYRRVPAGSVSPTIHDVSIRPVSRSSTACSPTLPPEQTRSAASRSQPPANTDSRASSFFSGSDSRS